MSFGDFRGAQFHNSAVGPNASVTNHWYGETAATLRTELASLRAQLQAVPDGDDARIALVELDGLEAEIARDEPAPAVVRSRWEAVRGRAAVALPVAADLAQIASLVAQLTGG